MLRWLMLCFEVPKLNIRKLGQTKFNNLTPKQESRVKII